MDRQAFITAVAGGLAAAPLAAREPLDWGQVLNYHIAAGVLVTATGR